MKPPSPGTTFSSSLQYFFTAASETTDTNRINSSLNIQKKRKRTERHNIDVHRKYFSFAKDSITSPRVERKLNFLPNVGRQGRKKYKLFVLKHAEILFSPVRSDSIELPPPSKNSWGNYCSLQRHETTILLPA